MFTAEPGVTVTQSPWIIFFFFAKTHLKKKKDKEKNGWKCDPPMPKSRCERRDEYRVFFGRRGKLPIGWAGIRLRSGDTHIHWPQDFPSLGRLLQTTGITGLCSATTCSSLPVLSCCDFIPALRVAPVVASHWPQSVQRCSTSGETCWTCIKFVLLCLFKGPFVRDSVASDGREAGRKGCRSFKHVGLQRLSILSYWFISFDHSVQPFLPYNGVKHITKSVHGNPHFLETVTKNLNLSRTTHWSSGAAHCVNMNSKNESLFILGTLSNWKYLNHYLNSVPFLFKFHNPGPLELGTGQNKLGRLQEHGATNASDRRAGQRDESARSPECRPPAWWTQPCIDSRREMACRQECGGPVATNTVVGQYIKMLRLFLTSPPNFPLCGVECAVLNPTLTVKEAINISLLSLFILPSLHAESFF